MINKVDNVNFSGRIHWNGFSKHTPQTKPYSEFYFMPELQRKNPIKEFFKKMAEEFNDIRNSLKPKIIDQKSKSEASGMTFEA